MSEPHSVVDVLPVHVRSTVTQRCQRRRATCLEPATHSTSATPHCPSHQSPTGGPSLSAADIAACPSNESARPVPGKLDFAVAAIDIAPHARAPQHRRASARLHLRTSARPRPLIIPLRV
jgi:hypothetical protein